jgi:hypothetical protein
MATQILAAKAGVYLAGRPTARFGFARVPWLMGTRGIGKTLYARQCERQLFLGNYRRPDPIGTRA